MFDTFNGKFRCDFDSIKKRPELAARVAHTIAMWSLVELSLSQLLSVILHSDAQVGATLFSTIRAESGRLAMIRAIAEDRLTPEMQHEYAALQKRITQVGSYRDAMAHGNWAASDDDPDCLILVDARHVATFIAAVTADVTRLKIEEKTKKLGEKYRKNARRYGAQEFDFIESEIKKLNADLSAFIEKVIDSTP